MLGVDRVVSSWVAGGTVFTGMLSRLGGSACWEQWPFLPIQDPTGPSHSHWDADGAFWEEWDRSLAFGTLEMGELVLAGPQGWNLQGAFPASGWRASGQGQGQARFPWVMHPSHSLQGLLTPPPVTALILGPPGKSQGQAVLRSLSPTPHLLLRLR